AVHRVVEAELLHQLTAAGDACLVIVQLDVLVDEVEHGRRHGDEAVLGEAVNDGADMPVQAEDLLYDDQRSLGRNRRIAAVGTDPAVGGFQTQAATHGVAPSWPGPLWRQPPAS